MNKEMFDIDEIVLYLILCSNEQSNVKIHNALWHMYGWYLVDHLYVFKQNFFTPNKLFNARFVADKNKGIIEKNVQRKLENDFYTNHKIESLFKRNNNNPSAMMIITETLNQFNQLSNEYVQKRSKESQAYNCTLALNKNRSKKLFIPDEYVYNEFMMKV